MERLVTQLLKNPGRALLLGVAVPLIAFIVQVSILFDPYQSNGSGPHLHSPTALELAGRQVYVSEGCQYCHTQAVRDIATELTRYAPPESYGFFPRLVAAESDFDAPSVRGSRRIGPDLARQAGRLEARELRRLLEGKGGSPLAQGAHRFGHLWSDDAAYTGLDSVFLSWRIRAMMQAGVPLSDPLQQSALIEIDGLTRGDALAAYVESLGARQKAFAGGYFQK